MLTPCLKSVRFRHTPTRSSCYECLKTVRKDSDWSSLTALCVPSSRWREPCASPSPRAVTRHLHFEKAGMRKESHHQETAGGFDNLPDLTSSAYMHQQQSELLLTGTRRFKETKTSVQSVRHVTQAGVKDLTFAPSYSRYKKVLSISACHVN